MKIIRKKWKILIILIIYSIVSFINLGDKAIPNSFKTYDANETSILQLDKESKISKIKLFVGCNSDDFEIYLDNDKIPDSKYYIQEELNYISVFKWIECDINSENIFNNIFIKSKNNQNDLGEIALYDEEGKKVNLRYLKEKDKKLIDEQNLVPEDCSYLNSTYFDEIYFTRAGYEQVIGREIKENTHPPLGKDIISFSIKIFGFNPFAYRLFQNLAGICMIYVMYCIGIVLFKKERYGIISALIMSLDGMHFVQTRIGTVDSFLVLFSLVAFLFMLKYIFSPLHDLNIKKVKYLFFSGVFLGMAISTKWTGFWVALGLAIIFISQFIYKIVINKRIKLDNIKTFLLCIIFFILVPILIYIISYIPNFLNPGCRIKDFKTFIEYQINMYKYHANLNATHSFSSKWYTWPFLYKPIWYYQKTYYNSMKSTISCLGNPMIWWCSIIFVIEQILYCLLKRNPKDFILIVMILATWMPYIFIGRIMFLYHYFITLPYVMLSIVWGIAKLERYLKKIMNQRLGNVLKLKNLFVGSLITVFFCCFLVYYPIYSGMKVDTQYIDRTKVMESWIY